MILPTAPDPRPFPRARKFPGPLQIVLTLAAVAVVVIMFVLPLVLILTQALGSGWNAYAAAVVEPDAISAMKLTLLVAAISVPLNLIFGLTASWAIAKFDFSGKALLISLIELPLAVSPVISGLIYVLLFGAQSYLGSWLISRDMQIIFAVPGIVLATLFVTFPYVARQLIPIMQQQGRELEEVSAVMGATGLQTFWFVTLPQVKWALFYGVILCNARAMGEFGAVSVVSGHIRGQTNTLPLHVEILYNEYNFVAAFACASVLVALAVLTLIAKNIVEHFDK